MLRNMFFFLLFRNRNKQNCMDDRPMDIDPNFHEVIKEMPGQIMGPNEQCKEKLGFGSFYGWVSIIPRKKSYFPLLK